MNIYKIVIQTGKAILAAGFLLTLTACKLDLTLLDSDNVMVGNGTLEVRASFPSPAHVVMNGKEFAGTWSATKVYEEDVAKRHRLLGARSYEEYMQGNARDQLWHGRAVLTAQDSTEMVCDFYYRAQPESGNCSVDGDVMKLKFSD